MRLAEQLRPDVVIMDYSMPVMNGLDAAKAVHEALPGVPIFLDHGARRTVRRFLGDLPISGIFMKDNLVPLLERRSLTSGIGDLPDVNKTDENFDCPTSVRTQGDGNEEVDDCCARSCSV